MVDRFDKRDARILAAAAVRSPFVVSLGFERDSKPLHSARIATFVKFYAGNADARIIAPRDKPRKQVKLSIGAASCRRIYNAFHLMRIVGVRLHDLPHALQLKAGRQLCPTQAMIASITRFVS